MADCAVLPYYSGNERIAIRGLCSRSSNIKIPFFSIIVNTCPKLRGNNPQPPCFFALYNTLRSKEL